MNGHRDKPASSGGLSGALCIAVAVEGALRERPSLLPWPQERPLPLEEEEQTKPEGWLFLSQSHTWTCKLSLPSYNKIVITDSAESFEFVFSK